jgi:hypothetical protein
MAQTPISTTGRTSNAIGFGLFLACSVLAAQQVQAQAARQLPTAACLALEAAAVKGVGTLTKAIEDADTRARSLLDAAFDGARRAPRDCNAEIAQLSAPDRQKLRSVIPGVKSAVLAKAGYWKQQEQAARAEHEALNKEYQTAGNNVRKVASLRREAAQIEGECRECGQSADFQQKMKAIAQAQEKWNNRVLELAPKVRDAQTKQETCEKFGAELARIGQELEAL